MPGVAEYETVGTTLVPKLPKPGDCSGAVAAVASRPWLAWTLGLGVLAAAGAGAWHLYKKR